MLDYRAKKLGGLAKLSPREQHDYVMLAFYTNFLTDDVVAEIINELGLPIDINELKKTRNKQTNE